MQQVTFVCSICAATTEEIGADAWPFRGRCCADCYRFVVIPNKRIFEDKDRAPKL